MQNLNSQNQIFTKTPGVQATVLVDGRWLLHNTSQNAVTTLSAPAGILWELCDGQSTFDQLLTQLQELYPDTAYKTLQEETARTLHLLHEQGLLQDVTP